MAVQALPGVSKETFIAAMKYVYIREAARLQSGKAGVAAMDAFMENGGIYEQFGTPALRKVIDDFVDAATQNPPIGWDKGTMNWGKWACFCRFCATLDLDALGTVESNLRKGFADPWNVETEGGRTSLPSPLSPCADPSNSADMFCCPQEIVADPFYSGSMPGHHKLTWTEILLMTAGAVTAVGAVVWFGSERGWFKHAGS